MSRLIDAGIDLNARDLTCENAFDVAMKRSFSAEVVSWGLELAADKMSTVTLTRIYETAVERSKDKNWRYEQIVEWIEMHIPERIPIARRRPVPAGVVDYD